MSDSQRNTTEQILDLLLDALLERQKSRAAESAPEKSQAPNPKSQIPNPKSQTPEPKPQIPTAKPQISNLQSSNPPIPTSFSSLELPPLPVSPAPLPERLPSIQLDRMLGRLLLVLIGIVIIINIPFNRYGTNLARAAPDSAALVIRDGLLLKGSGPEVYVLQDDRLRWITTLDAFEWYGYRWEQVHEVEDTFLEDFERGLPIHLLLKCATSPHVYALEDGRKRWIKDIPTFEAQQYIWEDIKPVSCGELRNIPDGRPIPEDAGTPPQP